MFLMFILVVGKHDFPFGEVKHCDADIAAQPASF